MIFKSKNTNIDFKASIQINTINTECLESASEPQRDREPSVWRTTAYRYWASMADMTAAPSIHGVRFQTPLSTELKRVLSSSWVHWCRIVVEQLPPMTKAIGWSPSVMFITNSTGIPKGQHWIPMELKGNTSLRLVRIPQAINPSFNHG